MSDQATRSKRRWARRAGVLSLAAICGLYAEVTLGSSGAGVELCATLALLSGVAGALLWITVLGGRSAFPGPDDDGRGDVRGSVPPPSSDGGAELRWRSFERDFREYASRAGVAA